MVNYQTTVQKSNTIRFGNAKIEVGENVDSLVNLGAVTGVEFTEGFEAVVFNPSNAPEIQGPVINHTATVKVEMWEVDLENLALIRGGMDLLTVVEGTPVSVENEAHTLTGTGLVRLNHKMGDGSEVESIVVTDASGNAAVRNTDYVVAVDASGFTCIGRVAASTAITSGEGILVDYSYTPNASVKLSTGGLNTINPRVVRLTNTNAAGKEFRITVYAAKNQGGLELSLPDDDGDEPMKPPIELRGIIDPTRIAGDQLFEIYDEQGV
jgi:hypothetical protein